MQVHHRIFHNDRIIGASHCLDHRTCCKQNQKQENSRPQDADHGRFADSLTDTVDTSSTEILTGKGGIGTCNAGQRHVGDDDDTAGCCMCGNDGGSQCIYSTLQDHRTDGKNRIHQPHGKTGGEKVIKKVFLVGKMPFGRDQEIIIFIKVSEAQNGGDQLCKDSGASDSGHADVQAGNGKKIQKQVQHTGKHQKIQGCLAVSNCPQKPGTHVVKKCGGHSAHDNEEISPGFLEDIFGSLDQVKERIGK